MQEDQGVMSKNKKKKSSKKEKHDHNFTENTFQDHHEMSSAFLKNKKIKKEREEKEEQDREDREEKNFRKELQEFKKIKESLEQQISEEKKNYLYLSADMDNLRKQMTKDREDALRFSKKSMSLEVLKILDILQQALNLKVDQNSWKDFYKGISMTEVELKKTLTSFGLEEKEIKIGEPFDPEVHEAISVENHKEIPKDHIIRIFCKPYEMYGKIVRSGKVVVSKGSEDLKKL